MNLTWFSLAGGFRRCQNVFYSETSLLSAESKGVFSWPHTRDKSFSPALPAGTAAARVTTESLSADRSRPVHLAAGGTK